MNWLGRWQVSVIARRLGRTEGAVIERCIDLHIAPTKNGCLTSSEAARMAGVSQQYMTRMARQRRIKAHRLSGQSWWLFGPLDVLDWMESRRYTGST